MLKKGLGLCLRVLTNQFSLVDSFFSMVMTPTCVGFYG
jgi:hypothetical protein